MLQDVYSRVKYGYQHKCEDQCVTNEREHRQCKYYVRPSHLIHVD